MSFRLTIAGLLILALGLPPSAGVYPELSRRTLRAEGPSSEKVLAGLEESLGYSNRRPDSASIAQRVLNAFAEQNGLTGHISLSHRGLRRILPSPRPRMEFLSANPSWVDELNFYLHVALGKTVPQPGFSLWDSPAARTLSEGGIRSIRVASEEVAGYDPDLVAFGILKKLAEGIPSHPEWLDYVKKDGIMKIPSRFAAQLSKILPSRKTLSKNKVFRSKINVALERRLGEFPPFREYEIQNVQIVPGARKPYLPSLSARGLAREILVSLPKTLSRDPTLRNRSVVLLNFYRVGKLVGNPSAITYLQKNPGLRQATIEIMQEILDTTPLNPPLDEEKDPVGHAVQESKIQGVDSVIIEAGLWKGPLRETLQAAADAGLEEKLREDVDYGPEAAEIFYTLATSTNSTTREEALTAVRLGHLGPGVSEVLLLKALKERPTRKNANWVRPRGAASVLVNLAPQIDRRYREQLVTALENILDMTELQEILRIDPHLQGHPHTWLTWVLPAAIQALWKMDPEKAEIATLRLQQAVQKQKGILRTVIKEALKNAAASETTGLEETWQNRLSRVAQRLEMRGWVHSAQSFTAPFLKLHRIGSGSLPELHRLMQSLTRVLEALSDPATDNPARVNGRGYRMIEGTRGHFSSSLEIPSPQGTIQALLTLRDMPTAPLVVIRLAERSSTNQRYSTIGTARIGTDKSKKQDRPILHLDLETPSEGYSHLDIHDAWQASDGSESATAEERLLRSFLVSFIWNLTEHLGRLPRKSKVHPILTFRKGHPEEQHHLPFGTTHVLEIPMETPVTLYRSETLATLLEEIQVHREMIPVALKIDVRPIPTSPEKIRHPGLIILDKWLGPLPYRSPVPEVVYALGEPFPYRFSQLILMAVMGTEKAADFAVLSAWISVETGRFYLAVSA